MAIRGLRRTSYKTELFDLDIGWIFDIKEGGHQYKILMIGEKLVTYRSLENGKDYIARGTLLVTWLY